MHESCDVLFLSLTFDVCLTFNPMVYFSTLCLFFVAREIKEMHLISHSLGRKTNIIPDLFFTVQKEKAHGQNGGIQASWEGVHWRGPPVEMNPAV